MGLYQNILESADGGAFVNLRDGSGTGITSTLISGKQALDVNIATASVVVGVADESAFTYGTSTYQPIGGVFNSSITALTSGQGGAFSVTANRDLRVNLRTAAGVELGNNNADGLWVKLGDGTNTGSFSATSEQFTQIRQGGNVANVNGSNQLLTFDGNAGSILALMTPATGTLTQVAVTTSSQTLLASNAARKGFSVMNATTKIIYIAAAATATTAAYTFYMQPNSFYESVGNRVFTGQLSVIGATGVSGSAVVTEYT